MNQPKNTQPVVKPKRQRSLPSFLVIVFVIGLICWLVPLPKLHAESTYTYKSPVAPVSLNWPAYGQSAVGAVGYGLLDSHGEQVPAPMASLTKVVTAMAVLSKKPLTAGSQGDTINIGPADVASYNDYSSKGGSVVAVTDGEQISEYQALQALLLPSANNMADTLARWAFGSVDNFTAYANSYVKTLGLKQTHVADASGFSPNSVSTATDLTLLGLAAYNNPVLRDVVSQKTAALPVAGNINNTNWLLGTNGYVGIKTGNTEQAGGCYLFATNQLIHGQKILVIGTIMDAPDLATAISDSRPLAQSVQSGFSLVTVAHRGQVVGIMLPDWGDKTNIYARDDLKILTWNTRQVASTMQVKVSGRSLKSNQTVGKLIATVWDKKISVDLAVADKVSGPSWSWRLVKRYFGG
jgi:serine-type D-Ala-D-Ala carboxypeptidase (penicillin-binding protein 5/6)